MRWLKLRFILVAVVMAVCSISALAQTVTGDIGGVVTDSTGALVAGAKVTATNVATNLSTTATSNREGVYSIRFLPIGTYKVTIQAKGFGSQAFGPFLLEVAQVAAINAKLQPGEQSTVTVEAGETPILNTENGMISTTISQTMVDELPVNGHNFAELTQLVPGSTVADGNQWNGAGQSSPNNSGERTQSFATLPNINGNRTYTTNFTLDGISIVDTGANLSNGFGVPLYNPPPESLQNVTVISTVPPAEYGDGATQILSIMKDGTSKYHGSLSAYLQNWEMDANLFQNKRVLPGNAFTPRTKYTQTNYNATFSGPVPFLKKFFFFGDYEAYRKPSAGFSKINVPLNAWRGNTTAAAGSPDTSVSPLAGYAYFGNAVNQLYDSQNGFAPFNQTVNGTLYQNLVPIRNPVAKYLFANAGLLPLPNNASSAGPITGDYQGTTKSLTRNDQGDIKIDYNPTDKDKFFARWTDGEATDYPSLEITPVAFTGKNEFPFKQFALNYTRVITPSILNEARAGFTRASYRSYNLDLSGQFNSGEAAVGIPWPNPVPGFSAQNFNQSTNSTGTSSFGTAAAGNIGIDNQFSYGDDLTWQHGRHVSKFGAQLFRAQNNFFLNTGSGLLGSFGYNGVFTGDPAAGASVGYDFADFLLDYVQSYGVSLQTGDVGTRQYRFAVFAQDDFRVLPNLTINYGLRWEYDQPLYEVHNKISNINTTTGALQLAGVNGNSRSLYKPTYNDFGPRVGFAYSVNPKLVVRGGFGITTFMDYNVIQHHTGNAPFHLTLSNTAVAPTTTSGGSPFAVTNGFPAANPGASFTTWNNLKPLVETQYSLVTEYAISPKQSVALQYVGNSAQHLADQRNINQETLANTASSAQFNGDVLSTAAGNITITSTSQVELYETEAYSNFNGGEATYRLRPTSGFEIQVNYTYSHAMGDTSGIVAVNDNNVAGGNPQNNFCLRCEYGPSASDSRHMLNGNWVYHLPFGRGKQFGTNMPLWLDEIVGGWTTSGSAVLFSGQPNTITANGGAVTGGGTLRANHYRHLKVVGVKDGVYTTGNYPGVSGGTCTGAGVDGSTGSCTPASGPGGANTTAYTVPYVYVNAGAWGNDPSAVNSGTGAVSAAAQAAGYAQSCGNAGHDDGICAYGQPAAQVTGQAPIFGTASVGSERAQGFRQVDASVAKNFTLFHENTLQFVCEAYNVGNIVSYNNQGRTVNGGSTWGFVQSTRSEPRQLELELKYKF
jgi:hypothetical protein